MPVAVPKSDLLEDAISLAAELSVQLNDFFIEREPEIRCALTALVAGEHFVMVGPPGTAKSLLTTCFAEAICDVQSEDYFQWLMTKYSVPAELFGPISLKGLEQDDYRTVTARKFPRAKVAFLDEVFKANSAILNAFLTILNERKFDNGAHREDCPLEVCFAASNEFPQDDSLGALYDRFVFRRWVDYISDRDKRRQMLLSTAKPNITVSLTTEHIEALRAAREEVDVSGIIEPFLDVIDGLAKAGLAASDRKQRQCIKVLKSVAALEGRDYCEAEDLLILADVLWDNKDDRAAVLQAIGAAISPDLVIAMKAYDAAVEQYSSVDHTDTATFKATAGKANANLISTIRELEGLDTGESPAIFDLCEKIAGMQHALAVKLKVNHGF